MADFEFEEPKTKGTNRAAPPSKCDTCGGDRFVTARMRSPDQTVWMDDHNITYHRDRYHEEVAPCPDCNPIEVTYRRYDDKKEFRSLDPAATRQALQQ